MSILASGHSTLTAGRTRRNHPLELLSASDREVLAGKAFPRLRSAFDRRREFGHSICNCCPTGSFRDQRAEFGDLGLQSQVITGEGDVRMLESAVEWLGGLCLSALAFLMSLCFIGSIVAALRAVSRALDAADVWLHSDLR